MSMKRLSTQRQQLATPDKRNKTSISPDKGRSAKRNARDGNADLNNSVASAVEASDNGDEHGLNDANISEDEEGGTRIGDIYIPPPIPPHCSMESKGPRLIIKKIENHNFKSYAGKVILGPFHHCFTAIIGPNGSGKSNVIDSMLFVFGYRANKIRCKKISTLLHNSAMFPNMNSCSVAVHFGQIIDCEDGGCKDVPDSEIIIERTAFRDNSSFYSINGRRVQFKEVSKLLKQHNVDLDHNRFLILQGEVESISMMKPKGQTENECGMLEYLEDIVGTTRYKEPLKKINDRVEQLTEERTEKHNRCKMAEREMKDLEKPYTDAVNHLKTENEYMRSMNMLVQKYVQEKTLRLEEYLETEKTIKTELSDHDTALANMVKDRQEKEKLVQEEQKEYDNLRKNKDDVAKKLEKAKKQYVEVQQTMAASNKRRKQNKTQLDNHQDEIEQLKKIPEKNQKEIEECEKKVKSLTKQKSEGEEELQKNYTLLEERTKPLVEKRENMETELIGYQKNVDEAKADLAYSEQELKILKHDETTETRKFECLKSSYEESERTLEERRNNVSELEQKIPTLGNEVKATQERLIVLRNEEEQMSHTLMQLKTEINEKVKSAQLSRSNNKVVDFLMRQKHEGKLPGVLGRLGDLGGIDAKYDVAISTACGRLDNIIVDTVNTAQECIELLKRYDVGRTSFIALEKVKHYANHSGPIQTPENAHRLYDLVRVEDERVLPAFYFALRNTLVATDLEQGTRIAYGARRFRVVTLKGDVIEISGTMSGGGRTQIRGKMSTKVQTKTAKSADTSMVSQKALEDMQVQAEDLQSKINYNQQEQGRLEKDLQALKTNAQKSEADLHKIKISIKSLEQQLPSILKQLEAQKVRMTKTTTDASKVKDVEEQIKNKKKTLKESEEAAKEITIKIDKVKKEIDEIHGNVIKSVQKKISNLGTQIKKLENNISKLKVEITTSERNVKQTEKKIESLQEDILKAQEEITTLSVERQKFDDEIAATTEELTKAEESIKNAKSGSSGIHKEILELQKQESDNKLKRVEIEQKVQEIEKKISEVRATIPHWKKKLDPLKLHQIPDCEPPAPFQKYTNEELDALNLKDLQFKVTAYEESILATKDKVNFVDIENYQQKRNIYLERVKYLEDITSKRNEMRQLYDDVRKRRYNEFMKGFQIITRKLKEMYQMITQGGDAELELMDSMDPFTEGVTFSVRPPKKTWKNISNLSGGEKTLSSLALVFALHYYKPSPLYFMDEIDAALDFKNISIVAHYIKERTKNAQFIIISLRSNMFELSDYIVGIYKVTDCTDSVTIKNHPPPVVSQPLTQTQTQNTQGSIFSGNRHNTEVVSHSIIMEDEGIENTENDPPVGASSQMLTLTQCVTQNYDRESTFAPTIESTALSNTIHMNITGTNNPIVQTESTTSNQARNTDSINDCFFKKPLPRNQI